MYSCTDHQIFPMTYEHDLELDLAFEISGFSLTGRHCVLRFHTNHLLANKNPLNGRVNRTDMLFVPCTRGRSQLSAAFTVTLEAAKRVFGAFHCLKGQGDACITAILCRCIL